MLEQTKPINHNTSNGAVILDLKKLSEAESTLYFLIHLLCCFLHFHNKIIHAMVLLKMLKFNPCLVILKFSFIILHVKFYLRFL